MEKIPLKNLNLCTPLTYKKIEALPSSIPENGDFLLCYNLNPSQSRSFEPISKQFLGNHVFTGVRQQENDLELPAGDYLFMQYRDNRIMSRDKWLEMAIEQQKDGLWERYSLQNLLYVRFLFEDEMYVTQVLRPYSLTASTI